MLSGLKINNAKSGQGSNVMFLPKIVAELLNADFDGDTVQVLFNLANTNVELFNDILNGLLAAQKATKAQLDAVKGEKEPDTAASYGANMIKEIAALTNPNVAASFATSTHFGQFLLGHGSNESTRRKALLAANRKMTGKDNDFATNVIDTLFRDFASETIEQKGISAKKSLLDILKSPDVAWDADILGRLEDAVFNYKGTKEQDELLSQYKFELADEAKTLFSINLLEHFYGEDASLETLKAMGIFDEKALEDK
jgi:hypothetical protein